MLNNKFYPVHNMLALDYGAFFSLFVDVITVSCGIIVTLNAIRGGSGLSTSGLMMTTSAFPFPDLRQDRL
jgi:hypothetical protein